MEENATRMDDMGSVEDLEALRKQHKDLESRLAALDRHLSLTAAEQAERARLKKEKLAIKDRIQLLLPLSPAA
jgi:hypothetical protein